MSKSYQLGPIISYGNEGTVYSGIWHGNIAAIKVLINQYARHVEQEFKLVKSFNHVNIIKYYDLEYEQGTAYLGMELFSGGNLYRFIQNKFNSDSYWTTVDSILKDIAQGMLYLHNHHIIQGDLKSHNILLREETLQAVICDFGISKCLDNEKQENKRRNSAKGTIRWMSPELCTPPPEPSSYSSDVWSYGCIILEITSAREPWIELFNDDHLLFQALRRKENASIFARHCENQSGPSNLRQLLTQCCAWSKYDRPQFIDIIRHFTSKENESTTSIDDDIDCMSVTDYAPDLEYSATKNNSISPNIENECLNKSNNHRGRLTGELYTSTGSANGRPIYEGLKGGRYYLSFNGSKVYIHK